eukprot:483280_1
MSILDNSPKLLRHRVDEQFCPSEEKNTSRDGGWNVGEEEEVKKLIVSRLTRPAHEPPPSLRGGHKPSGKVKTSRRYVTSSAPPPRNDEPKGEGSLHLEHSDAKEEYFIIPELQDKRNEEYIGARVDDDSPKNSLQTLPSLCELEDATQCVLPTLSKGLDMSILTRVLVPENMLHEPADPWDFNMLLRDVSKGLSVNL